MLLFLKSFLIMMMVMGMGFILGRLAFRAILNLLVGGRLFGGNFL